MEWIVSIIREDEEERKQRIRIVFNPMAEKIYFHGEVKLKDNKWHVFSLFLHKMEISLEEMQKKMEDCVSQMRRRLKEYENLDKGFSVLKEVGFNDED